MTSVFIFVASSSYFGRNFFYQQHDKIMFTVVAVILIQSFWIVLIHPQCIPLESRFSSSSVNDSSDFIIFDGDIAIHESDSPTTIDAISDKLSEQQSVKRVSTSLWPNGIIPFTLHNSVTDSVKKAISLAITHWESESCIRFRLKEENDEFWITFRSDSTGCYSFVGKEETCHGQGQPVSLSKGCDSFIVAAHEIGHAVGLRHQHNRPDRDDFVHVNWKNLISGSNIYFRKESYDTFGIPYDYTSLMQYNQWHFSKDVMNKTAMVTSNPLHQRFLGKVDGLSFRDKKIINLMYKCSSNCSTANMTCFNEGFLSDNCSCVCPPNTTGKWCERIITEDYYDAVDSLSCGGYIGDESVLSTPSQGRKSLNCVWVIDAPQHKIIQLTIQEFKIQSRSDLSRLSTISNAPPNFKCINESVEIRLDDPYDGRFFCGNDLKPGVILNSTTSRVVILIFSSVHGSSSSFKAVASFIDKNSSSPSYTAPTTRPPSYKNTTTTTPSSTVVRPETWNPWNVFYRLLPLDTFLNLIKNVKERLLDFTRGLGSSHPR
jgi:hypothetical protein